MKGSKRAERRAHRERLIRNFQTYDVVRSFDPATQAKRSRRMVNHGGSICSCLMCGHRRETGGDTIQERRIKCETVSHLLEDAQ
jgi:hypothetical protein